MIKKIRFRRLTLRALSIAITLCLGLTSTLGVFAQRRPGHPYPDSEYNGSSILPAGTTTIPEGMNLIVEMDTKLNSGTAEVSDRFLARVAIPVDSGERTLIPIGTIVEGHVTSVKKAKWGHRSGELGITFDYLRLSDGKILPLRARLVSGRKRVDEEGQLKPGGTGKRDALIAGGGAVAGAGVGVLTTATVLAGTGVGAAAGLTAILIMKGSNVDIQRGERFRLELVQPLNVYRGYYGNYYGTSLASRRRLINRPIPLRDNYYPGGGTEYPGLRSDQNEIRTPWSRVSIHDFRATRGRDGILRVVVTSETPSTGWRIYTYHEIQSRDTLDVRLMGIPPSQYGVRQISYPTAPVICVEDPGSEIRHIIIHGQNGERAMTIGQGEASGRIDTYSRSGASRSFSSRYPSEAYPPERTTPRRRSSDSFDRPSDYNRPSVSSGNSSSLARQTTNQIENLRSNYAANVGLYILRDGTAESNGSGHRTTESEKRLFDDLTNLLDSSRSMISNTSSSRQRYGQQLQTDTQNAQRSWDRVKSTGVITQDLDRQWQNILGNLRTMVDTSAR